MKSQNDLYTLSSKMHPYPLLFTNISGSHAYEFADPDSDYDVHGVHILPVWHLLSQDPHKHETIEYRDEPGIDMVTHDVRKFIFLLLKGNGNVLEDLYSPLQIQTSSGHQELARIAKGCITKQVASHYRGMAFNQQRRLRANDIKKFLHLYRCLLMGIHAMNTGTIMMDVPSLANLYNFPYVHQLIAWKREGCDFIPDGSWLPQEEEIERLKTQLASAQEQSTLPERVSNETRSLLEDFVVKVRLGGI